jgi:hypothetical protein
MEMGKRIWILAMRGRLMITMRGVETYMRREEWRIAEETLPWRAVTQSPPTMI